MFKTKRRRITAGILILVTLMLAVLFADSGTAPQPVGQMVSVGACRIHYIAEGSGQPIVFLHGTEGSLNDFRLSPLWSMLQGHGRLIAFDRPGRGVSTPGTYTITEQAAIMHELFQKLGIHRPILVAHSWSGALALTYCINLKYRDNVKAVVLLSGWAYPLAHPLPMTAEAVLIPGFGLPIAQFGFRFRESMIIEDQLKEGFGSHTVPPAYRADALTRWCWSREQIVTCLTEVEDVNDWLGGYLRRHYDEITVPVVAMAGDADKSVPPEQAEWIAKAVKHGRAVLLKGQPHYLQFTSAPEVAHEIKQFIH